jgi:N-acetylglutamate synthase-like GNAT family acetyltransferase
VVVAEKRRNRGLGTAIVKHLIEYSPVDKVYIATDVVDYFLKSGFTETSTVPEELGRVLDIECSVRGKRGSVLMTYEKK